MSEFCPVVSVAAALVLSLALVCRSNADEGHAAPIIPSSPFCQVAQVETEPDLDRAPADPLWQTAQPLGPLYSGDSIEPPERGTDLRFLARAGKLYVRALCRTRDAGGLDGEHIDLYITQGEEARFPYLRVRVTADGGLRATAFPRAFRPWKYPIPSSELDASAIDVRTGRSDWGWWAAVAVPTAEFSIPADFHGNFVRRRAGGGEYAWAEIHGGSIYFPYYFGRCETAAGKVEALPALELPARLAVGSNQLSLLNWNPRCALLVNGAETSVEGDRATVTVEDYGPVTLQIRADGRPAGSYSCDVRRPLVIEAAEPFHADPGAPLRVKVRLNVASDQPLRITIAAECDGAVSEETFSVANGESEIELPPPAGARGEVALTARGRVETGEGVIALSAGHWCVAGAGREDLDRFRDGIDGLDTLSLYRAGLADACAFYRLIQAGDGRCRHIGRRGLAFTEWSYPLVYAFAILYKTDWAENPYFGDERFLRSAVAAMAAGLNPEGGYKSGGLSRPVQAYLLAYELLKDDIDPPTRDHWRSRLIDLTQHIIDSYITPASNCYTYYSLDVGTGTNHFAYYAANLYTAGRVLERPDWLATGRDLMLAIAGHEEDGQFAERRGVPATHYTWLTMNGLGEYWKQSGDESVVETLRRCVEFSWQTSLPDLDIMLLHDGRNNHYHRYDFGDFVLSLSPRGRLLADRRARARISSKDRPSGSSPEYWFRNAENAVYFEGGPTEEAPREAEFSFLDGRGLIRRTKGFIYGLSAICLPPTAEQFWLDPQNAIELHHSAVGPVLHGANSIMQPEAGSFIRKVGDRTVFLPRDGAIERSGDGHLVQLEFDGFSTRLYCTVVSDTEAVVRVELLSAEGDEPVVFSFFPAVEGGLRLQDNGGTLAFGRVRLSTDRPVEIERDFRIASPYSMQREVDVKAVRAWVALEEKRPFEMRIEIIAP
ncbi:MAG: hypothetical protein ACYTAN_13720 [Planctomycetota bacterium]|jgi:hypothetical protein